MNIKYCILILAIIVGLLSCQSNSQDNSKNGSESAQELVASPRIMERNEKYGLVLLNESQIKEIEDKVKSIDTNLPVIGILMFGYYGSICATDFGLSVPPFSVQMMPLFTV